MIPRVSDDLARRLERSCHLDEAGEVTPLQKLNGPASKLEGSITAACVKLDERERGVRTELEHVAS